MDTMRAQLPENGTYDILPYTEHFVPVELPASEQDVGFPDEAEMHVALWLPDVPEGTKVPVIMTIHPYYDFGGEGMPGVGADSNPNTIPDGGVGKWVYDMEFYQLINLKTKILYLKRLSTQLEKLDTKLTMI